MNDITKKYLLGKRVVGFTVTSGAFSSRVITNQRLHVKIPYDFTFSDADTYPSTFETVYKSLKRFGCKCRIPNN
jgi:NADPH:quinone reductase-like Zn-dependent oxidoreductase